LIKIAKDPRFQSGICDIIKDMEWFKMASLA
jgi:hypothetical protein